MPVQDSAGRWWSEDHRWWWDGSRWQRTKSRPLTRHEYSVAFRDVLVGLIVPWLVFVVLIGLDPRRAHPANVLSAGYLITLAVFAGPIVLAAGIAVLTARSNRDRWRADGGRLINLALGGLFDIVLAMPIMVLLVLGVGIGVADTCVADPEGGLCSGFTAGFFADFVLVPILAIAYLAAGRRRARRRSAQATGRPPLAA